MWQAVDGVVVECGCFLVEGSASLQVPDSSPRVGEHSGAGSSITPQPGWSWVLADFGVTRSQVSPIPEEEGCLRSCSDSIILGLCCPIEMFSSWGLTVISHNAAPSLPVQPRAEAGQLPAQTKKGRGS